MTFGMAQASQLDGGWGTIAALVAADGSATAAVVTTVTPLATPTGAAAPLCWWH